MPREITIVSIVGARPQFIKLATVSRAIAQLNRDGRVIRDVIVHTGQHFDPTMSDVFFDQLDIPTADYNLGVAGLSHAAMTARMMERLEPILVAQRPDWVVVYGDTNSTLAAALTAVKLHLPVAHVEAGLRSFNMRMPEEVNRTVTDTVSQLLLCPTLAAVNNLTREGRRTGVLHVGDVMYDAALFYKQLAANTYPLTRWGVEPSRYVLSTIHRAENTNDPDRFLAIWSGLLRIADDYPVLFPVHPRTRLLFGELIGRCPDTIRIMEPVSYLEMVSLQLSAHAIVTDSGGVQKEAFFHRVPCFTVRDETEWVETVELGWNVLCGADAERLIAAWRRRNAASRSYEASPFGDGQAAARIVAELARLPTDDRVVPATLP